ncbi:MAG: hypothetical protein J6B64_03990 [Bacilli bacterium]|nr:hypothetical protein [Bacilli bacterium]MBP3635453.1 hypothetical protein [Bacilli bacterium]
MQIRVENLFFNGIENVSFDIEREKITGIICNNIDDLGNINESIYENKKQKGIIKYIPRYNIKKMGLISIKEINNMIYGNSYDFILSKSKEYKYNTDKLQEIIKIIGITDSILKRDISTLSTSEKIKVLFARVLLYNPDTILIDNIFPELDSKSRDKLFKILIKLNKFEHKTIVISTIDVDTIFEFVDNIILINNGVCLSCSDKYSSYENDNILDNDLIEKPLVVNISNKIYEKNQIKLGKNDSINELIKAIYREVR